MCEASLFLGRPLFVLTTDDFPYVIVLALDVALVLSPEVTITTESTAPLSAVERGPVRDVATLFTALNSARVANGLRPLALDSRLCEVARAHGLDMSRRRFFAHTSPDGATPFDRLDRAHVSYRFAGENLALERDPVAASRALVASPPHRRNMLEPHYARVGIAAIPSEDGVLFIEEFID